jgi:thymidylate kinase
VGDGWEPLALSIATVALVVAGIRTADARQVFQLANLESVFARAGDVVAARLPGNAIVITSRFSGSVRYYAGRRTIVWDVLDPAWLDRLVAYARDRGFEPYFLIDSSEEAAFRQRFGTSPLARLDWPPLIEIAPQVRIYAPADRDRYLRGEARLTEYVR